MRAQRIASRLMVELCGAKLVPGTIDVAAEIPAPRRDLRCAARGSRGCSGWRSTQADQVAYLERLGFGVEADGDDLEVDGAARPPLRRHPRGRPDRGGRPGPRLRRAPADDAARGRPGRSAASAASSGCGAAPRTRCATSASTRSSAGASPTPASRRGCGSPPTTRAPSRSLLANPLSEDQSAMRTTLLGSLLDVAARNLARGADARRPLRVRPRLPAPTGRPPSDGGPLAGDFPGERPAPVAEPHRIGALAVGPLVPSSWRGGGEPADFFALKGVLEALAAAARRRARASSRRASRSCTRAAPPRSRSAATPPAGSASSTRWSAGPGTSRPRSASKSTRRRCSPPPAPARRPTRTSPPSRPSTRTSRSSSPTRSPAARGARRGARRRRRAAALGRGLRPLRGRAAGGGAQEPGAAARVPRRRPHPHRRGGRARCATRSRPQLARDRRVAA